MRKIFNTLLLSSACIFLSSFVECGIQVIHPKDLKKQLGNEGIIKSSLANFGHIIYGTSVVRIYLLITIINLDGKSILSYKE
jgi:hypothetical protein